MSKTTLQLKEWILLEFGILLFLSLTFLAIFFSGKFFFEKRLAAKENKNIEIYVEGAIEHPIFIQSSSPLSFKDVLGKISLKENADLSVYPKRKKITRSLSLFIPEKPYQECGLKRGLKEIFTNKQAARDE